MALVLAYRREGWLLLVLTQGPVVAGRGIPFVVEEPVEVVHRDCILFLAPQQTDTVDWMA